MTQFKTKALLPTQVHEAITFHTVLLGASGSGKTVISLEMFKYMPHSAFYVNTMRKPLEAVRVDPNGGWEAPIFDHTQGNPVKIQMQRKTHQKFNEFALEVGEMIDNVTIIQEALEVNERHLYIFIDEVQFFEDIEDTLRELILSGRNYHTFLVSVSQRPQNVDKNIFTQSNMVYSTFDEFDFYYCKRLGIKVYPLPNYVFQYYPKVNNAGDIYNFKMVL